MQVFSKIIGTSSKAEDYKKLKLGGLGALAVALAVSAGAALSSGPEAPKHLIDDMFMHGVTFDEVNQALLTPASMTDRDIQTAYKVKKIEAGFAAFIPNGGYTDDYISAQANNPEVAREAMNAVIVQFRAEAEQEVAAYADDRHAEVSRYRAQLDAELASYREQVNIEISERRGQMHKENEEMRMQAHESLIDIRDVMGGDLNERIAADPANAETHYAEQKALFESEKAQQIAMLDAEIANNAAAFEAFAAEEKAHFAGFAQEEEAHFAAFKAEVEADVREFADVKQGEIAEFAESTEAGFDTRMQTLAELEKDLEAIETLLK